jgi:putative DNA methylase
MIPKECKRLAEVDFPIAVVSRHAAREKSIRHGHPSTLHLWWARRPLASSRAMLLALLLPDPCDEYCPEEFKDEARDLLPPVVGPVGLRDADLRAKLLKFIGDFANWDLSADRTWLEAARGLVKAAHPEEPPLVVDPFAGGGSIPLEALRVGCEAFASDLNPVACLILKVMLEDIPRHGPELADQLRQAGREIKDAAVKELAEFYPDDPDGARPIAYIWARTVRCEAPNCGAEIPLIRSFWLSNKAHRKRALRYKVVAHGNGPPALDFEIFIPRIDAEVRRATVNRAKATCPCCGAVLAAERVRVQLSDQRGGANVIFDEAGKRLGGAQLLAVVSLQPGQQGRNYRLPNQGDYTAYSRAARTLAELASDRQDNDRCIVPDEPLPPIGTLGFRVQRYGMTQWRDLFNARQSLALSLLSQMIKSRSINLPIAVVGLLALAVGKTADLGNAAAPWKRDAECPVNLLGSQRVRPPWEWGEAVVTSEASGSFWSAYERSASALETAFNFQYVVGSITLADATDTPLPEDTATRSDHPGPCPRRHAAAGLGSQPSAP